jgi:hypothetical protein
MTVLDLGSDRVVACPTTLENIPKLGRQRIPVKGRLMTTPIRISRQVAFSLTSGATKG